MQKSDNINELAAALAKAQGQFASVKQSALVDFTGPKGRRKYSYAPLSEVFNACRKALADNGLSVVQLTTTTVEGKFQLESVLAHGSGQWLSSTFDVTAYPDDPQSQGSALTYARRYALSALLGVASEEDDDAETVSGKQAQVKDKGAGKTEAQDTGKHFCQVHKVPFFKRGQMKGYAHPIEGQAGQWCNEPDETPKPQGAIEELWPEAK